MLIPETVLWHIFRQELTEVLGKKRPVMIFCEETGYTASTVYYWKKLNRVPKEAFLRIRTIEIEQCDTTRFKGYHTNGFFNRVVELSNQSLPIRKIASILTSELGRKVTDGAVKSARYRQKHRIVNYRTRTQKGSKD